MNELARLELEKIAENNGGLLTPEKVLEAATHEQSPLHKYFQWDDTTAAKNWRIEQARHLICVKIRYFDAKGESQHTRAFVSLSSDRHPNGGYRTLVSVLGDEGMRAQMLETALAELKALQKKYDNLVELQPVFFQLENIVAAKSAGEAWKVRERMAT